MEGKSNKKKTTIQFTEELNKINSDIEVLGEYIKMFKMWLSME